MTTELSHPSGRTDIQEAPSALPSLAFGRATEAVAVQQYAILHSSWTITECVLFIHPDLPFLAASPDRTVSNPGIGEEGLLEVKCPSSVQVAPTVTAEQKASFCFQKVDGRVRLKKTHQHYWQVQGQIACCGMQWCDFCVYSGGELFVERVQFDREAWQRAFSLLKKFYLNHYGPELLYPGYVTE